MSQVALPGAFNGALDFVSPSGAADPFEDPFAWRERRAGPAPARKPSRRRRWFAAALAVAGMAVAVGVHHERAQIGAALAPLQSMLPALHGADARVEHVTSRLIDGGRQLLVEGDLVNATGREIEAPQLRLAVRSAERAEIFVWTSRPQTGKLAPWARTRFSSKLASPPSGGVEVAVALQPRGQ